MSQGCCPFALTLTIHTKKLALQVYHHWVNKPRQLLTLAAELFAIHQSHSVTLPLVTIKLHVVFRKLD